MKINYLLPLTFIIFFSSCNSTEKLEEKLVDDEIIGSWTLTEVITFDKENADINDAERTALANEKLTKGLTLQFFPDSSYTMFEGGNIKHGNWTYVNDKALSYGQNILKIDRFDEVGQMTGLLASIRNNDKGVESAVKFVEEIKKLKNYKEDPFYPGNNKWRERPLKKETNEEIVARLSNYILHNAYLLKAAYERNDVTVSFEYSRGVIKVFKGGIGVVKKNKINQTWKNYFYNDADAMKAFNLYSSYLDKQGVLRAVSTGDWVKDDYEILMKLYSQIQKTKVAAVERLEQQNS
ncbi:hypothetical protein N7U66_19000 [Lacinutrix neustonica]|uniref:Uncharacterized protein n=1 Tax=Lacinutrix neustonica TaxID=2980107 RepID=A0A9E8MUQ2_9FLAO|nr:hypothetical protein [Lacinutrix neustonica]WAC01912.1 hypothetical protein N7U66_19000 [Lacinutrix neustonica]